MDYEVKGYESEAAFDAVQFQIVDDGIRYRQAALRVGREALKEFPIVKVQSGDREFIEILRRDT
jgi:hypothetical protein